MSSAQSTLQSWVGDCMAHVFISYHKNSSRDYARKLADYLIEQGFDVWIDDRINYGDDWWEEINQALRDSGAVIVIMTTAALSSRWVRREVLLADSWNKTIFPLLLEGSNWTIFVATQYVQVTNEELPPLDFLEALSQHIERKAGPGVDRPNTRQAARNPLIAFVKQQPFVSLLIVAVIVGLFFSGVNYLNHNIGLSASPTHTRDAVVNMPTSSPTATASLQLTTEPTATNTLSPRTTSFETQVWIDATQTAALWTDTPTKTATQMATPTNTPIPPEYSITQTALQYANLTSTANEWTHTPSPTYTPTSIPTEFWLTQTALSAANLTLTAVNWTPTLSPTASPTLTPTATPPPPYTSLDNPITSNEQWRPYVDVYARAFNGVDMVLVPSGCFQMGNDPSAGAAGGALDGGRQCFDAFWMDRYEVSNAQFEQLGGRETSTSAFPSANQPRDTVTWFEARDFCALRGARLPTEAEWEYAARGVNALVYPWGTNWSPENLAWAGNSGSGTTDVGSHPQGSSWVGADDLLGNVWEWVSTVYGIDNGDYDFLDSSERTFPYPYNQDDGREQNTDNPNYARVIRGGSWLNDAGNFRAAIRDARLPSSANNRIGFRCARDY